MPTSRSAAQIAASITSNAQARREGTISEREAEQQLRADWAAARPRALKAEVSRLLREDYHADNKGEPLAPAGSPEHALLFVSGAGRTVKGRDGRVYPATLRFEPYAGGWRIQGHPDLATSGSTEGAKDWAAYWVPTARVEFVDRAESGAPPKPPHSKGRTAAARTRPASPVCANCGDPIKGEPISFHSEGELTKHYHRRHAKHHQAATYRVSYDRPRGLSIDGYSALVSDEPGPRTKAHIAAMCRRWNVSASIWEWSAQSFYVGRVSPEGVLTPTVAHNPESRAYHEHHEAAKRAYQQEQARSQAAVEHVQRVEMMKRGGPIPRRGVEVALGEDVLAVARDAHKHGFVDSDGEFDDAVDELGDGPWTPDSIDAAVTRASSRYRVELEAEIHDPSEVGTATVTFLLFPDGDATRPRRAQEETARLLNAYLAAWESGFRKRLQERREDRE